MQSRTHLSSRTGLLALLLLFRSSFAAGPRLARAETADDIALLDRSSRVFVNVVKAAQPAVVNIRVEKSVENKGGISWRQR